MTDLEHVILKLVLLEAVVILTQLARLLALRINGFDAKEKQEIMDAIEISAKLVLGSNSSFQEYQHLVRLDRNTKRGWSRIGEDYHVS